MTQYMKKAIFRGVEFESDPETVQARAVAMNEISKVQNILESDSLKKVMTNLKNVVEDQAVKHPEKYTKQEVDLYKKTLLEHDAALHHIHQMKLSIGVTNLNTSYHGDKVYKAVTTYVDHLIKETQNLSRKDIINKIKSPAEPIKLGGEFGWHYSNVKSAYNFGEKHHFEHQVSDEELNSLSTDNPLLPGNVPIHLDKSDLLLLDFVAGSVHLESGDLFFDTNKLKVHLTQIDKIAKQQSHPELQVDSQILIDMENALDSVATNWT